MNQVALVGNITNDPELRYWQSGAALAVFTIAVSHRSKHKGEWQDVNDGFFRCTAWRSIARMQRKPLKEGHAGVRGRQAGPSQLAGRRRQAPQVEI
jgi:single-strand DNA-binding protein